MIVGAWGDPVHVDQRELQKLLTAVARAVLVRDGKKGLARWAADQAQLWRLDR